jgi:hypothetical protein
VSRLVEVTDRFLVSDAPGLVDKLTEVLLVTSARMASLRRRLPANEAQEAQAVEEEFGRGVAIARSIAESVRSHGEPGAYAAAANIVRELERLLSDAVPNGMRLVVRCPPGPAIVTMQPSELRRVLVAILLALAHAEGARKLVVEVQHVPPTNALGPRVWIVLGCDSRPVGALAEAADRVRPLVQARGGTIEPAVARGVTGTGVVVQVPAAC